MLRRETGDQGVDGRNWAAAKREGVKRQRCIYIVSKRIEFDTRQKIFSVKSLKHRPVTNTNACQTFTQTYRYTADVPESRSVNLIMIRRTRYRSIRRCVSCARPYRACAMISQRLLYAPIPYCPRASFPKLLRELFGSLAHMSCHVR